MIQITPSGRRETVISTEILGSVFTSVHTPLVGLHNMIAEASGPFYGY